MKIDSSLIEGVNLAALPNSPDVANPVPLAKGGHALGTLYTFQKMGVGLGRHAHSDTNAHLSIVVRGRVAVHRASTGDAPMIYEAGDIADFDENDMHDIVALEGGTVVLNIVKYGLSLATLKREISEARHALDAAIIAADHLAGQLADAEFRAVNPAIVAR